MYLLVVYATRSWSHPVGDKVPTTDSDVESNEAKDVVVANTPTEATPLTASEAGADAGIGSGGGKGEGEGGDEDEDEEVGGMR